MRELAQCVGEIARGTFDTIGCGLQRLNFVWRTLRRRRSVPPRLALSNGLPHFRFLVLRGFFVKLWPAGSLLEIISKEKIYYIATD